MEYKKSIRKVINLSVVLFVLSIVMFSDLVYDWISKFFNPEGLFLSLFLFPIAIFIISIILLFRPEHIFRSWIRFAKYYLPIALVLIIISSESTGGLFAGGLGGGFDREGMIWFTSCLFLVISLIIITVKSLTHSKEAK